MSKKEMIVSVLSVFIMLVVCVVYAMHIRTIAVAGIAVDYYQNNILTVSDFMNNDNLYNKIIIIELGIYSIIQVVSFAMYLLGKKKILLLAFICEIILFIFYIIGLVMNDGLNSFYTLLMPISFINTLLYMVALKEK